MRRFWCGLSVLAMLGSQCLAASLHRPSRFKVLVATTGTSSALERVPAAAERIAATYGLITSTFRTVAHNREVGGVPDSYHLLGRAIDVVRRRGITHAQIAAALRTAGYDLIESLDEGDHSHFAFGPSLGRSHATTALKSPVPAGGQLVADQHGLLLWDLKAKGQAMRMAAIARTHGTTR